VPSDSSPSVYARLSLPGTPFLPVVKEAPYEPLLTEDVSCTSSNGQAGKLSWSPALNTTYAGSGTGRAKKGSAKLPGKGEVEGGDLPGSVSPSDVSPGASPPSKPIYDGKVPVSRTFIHFDEHDAKKVAITGTTSLTSSGLESATKGSQRRSQSVAANPLYSRLGGESLNIGSLGHVEGFRCCPNKRCYWFYTERGCMRGKFCDHCHLCLPRDKKAQRHNGSRSPQPACGHGRHRHAHRRYTSSVAEGQVYRQKGGKLVTTTSIQTEGGNNTPDNGSFDVSGHQGRSGRRSTLPAAMPLPPLSRHGSRRNSLHPSDAAAGLLSPQQAFQQPLSPSPSFPPSPAAFSTVSMPVHGYQGTSSEGHSSPSPVCSPALPYTGGRIGVVTSRGVVGSKPCGVMIALPPERQ